MDSTLDSLNLVQLVNFPTWSRFVRNELRESTLDHVYTNSPTLIIDLHNIVPPFGDHVVLIFGHSCTQNKTVYNYRRNWENYNKDKLCEMLGDINWDIDDDSVQCYWNTFENKLIGVVDAIVPMTKFMNSNSQISKLPQNIKNKINIRKRLLKRLKNDKSVELKQKIKSIDSEMKFFYHQSKAKKVRNVIKPGNSKSLWSAVNLAKDTNHRGLPVSMRENGHEIPELNLPERFAEYFDSKIKNVINLVALDETVYNGYRKLNSQDQFFMGRAAIADTLKFLKVKNSEGFDRIPQRILTDGADILIGPLTGLFDRIYQQQIVPDQWLVAKTIPVFKNKGDSKSIENYRPIANLCSTSKIFEKLLLKRILDIQAENNCDLTSLNQHGFKKGKSTATISLTIQSLIARALDEDNYVLMSSLDLSSAFDVVNIGLLLKRLTIVGLPNDVIALIEVWLRKRFYFVSIDGMTSTLYELLLGTVQGSILGPILYAIFVAPLFDLEYLEGFADNMFIPRSGRDLQTLKHDMEVSLDIISTWYKKSGLVVNCAKTEVCLFYKSDVGSVSVMVCNNRITTSNQMNVLGVIFDSKLQWNAQVASCLKKANKSLCALKIIRRYFNTKELLQILTSNVYSVLYYNSEVWHLPSLNKCLKHKLLSFSANAIKLALHYPKQQISYQNLHIIANRATPEMFCTYKLSLLLHKLYNNEYPIEEWTFLNFEQILTSRQTHFKITNNHNLLVGKNAITNRLNSLNDKIPLLWLNKSFVQFKLECKMKFLSF